MHEDIFLSLVNRSISVTLDILDELLKDNSCSLEAKEKQHFNDVNDYYVLACCLNGRISFNKLNKIFQFIIVIFI